MIKRISYNPDGSSYEYTEEPEPPKRNMSFLWSMLLVVNVVWTVLNSFDIYQLQRTPQYITPHVPTSTTP